MMVASELFPLQVRGFALGVATLINRVTSGTVALTCLSMSRVLTPSGAYFMFAGLAACAAQSLFALKAARPAVEPHPREKVLAFAGATCALNAGLALLLKVYLY